jgi:lipoyl-dependent peroxiredoxin
MFFQEESASQLRRWLMAILGGKVPSTSLKRNLNDSTHAASDWYSRYYRKGVFMERTASAVWHGGLKDGKGTISSQSGVLKETQYSFSTRFENGVGTNPEELIAAAHAGCFTMALSAQLGSAELKPESLETTVSVKLEKKDDGFAITKIHLTTRAKVPGATASAFETAAENAKAGCPISRLFKGNAEITLDAKLV